MFCSSHGGIDQFEKWSDLFLDVVCRLVVAEKIPFNPIGAHPLPPTGSTAVFTRVLLIWLILLTRRSTWRMGRQREKILLLCSLKRERRTRRDSSSSTSRQRKLLQRNLSVCWRMTISLSIGSIEKKFLPMERRDNRCSFWRDVSNHCRTSSHREID